MIATANLSQDWLNQTSGYYWESIAKNIYITLHLILNPIFTHRKLKDIESFDAKVQNPIYHKTKEKSHVQIPFTRSTVLTSKAP